MGFDKLKKRFRSDSIRRLSSSRISRKYGKSLVIGSASREKLGFVLLMLAQWCKSTNTFTPLPRILTFTGSQP